MKPLRNVIQFPIRQVLKNGRNRWQVTIPAAFHGKRRKVLFRDEGKAREFVLQTMEASRTVPGAHAVISPARMARLLRLNAELERLGIAPEDVPAILANHGAPKSGMLLGNAIQRFLEAKQGQGCRPKYLRKLKFTLSLFSTNQRETPVAALGVPEVSAFLNRNGYAPATRRSYRSDLGAFFAWCQGQEMTAKNPVERIPKPILDDKPVAILSPIQARCLLESVATHSPRLVPFVALVAFGGLRTSEARCLSWADIRGGHVHVEARVAKTRRRRVVPIEPTLAAWLEAARAAGCPLPPVGWDRDWREAQRMAGLSGSYPHNALRHSFGSYHYARHRNASFTASSMGNSEGMLFRHYREVVTAGDAEAYFSILPDALALAEAMRAANAPRILPPRLHGKWISGPGASKANAAKQASPPVVRDDAAPVHPLPLGDAAPVLPRALTAPSRPYAPPIQGVDVQRALASGDCGRKEAARRLRELTGCGQTAAYNALSPSGRFAHCLREGDEGRLSWAGTAPGAT